MRILPEWVKKFAPPAKWRIPVLLVTGIFFGLALYIFKLSNAPSYLSDRPETCVNCHIMTPQYATWSHSSHRENAHCNDCHVPHNNAVNKYFFKAKDGLRHATVFTLRNEPQVIFIKEEGKEVVQDNCIRCHSYLLTDSKLLMRTADVHHFRTERSCVECHRDVPHGRVNSLSSTPNARVPLPPSPVPDWLKELTKK
jgi:cytochrome c nitrite reductase small subunit